MSKQQFPRDFRITVGPFEIQARKPDDTQTKVTLDERGQPNEATTQVFVTRPTLKATFKIEKSSDQSSPNKAEVSIWNLTEKNRSRLQEKGADVLIEAGYVDNLFQLFKGTLTRTRIQRQDLDWVTTIDTGDGQKEYSGTRVNETFKAGTKVKDILNKLVGSFGLDAKSALAKIADGDFLNGFDELKKGVTLSGRSSDMLDKWMKSVGLEWSIQDGRVVANKADDTDDQETVRLFSTSGIIGSPEIGEDGTLTARALLNGNIAPNRRVRVLTELVEGVYKVNKVTHTGDTWGNGPWFSNFVARELYRVR